MKEIFGINVTKNKNNKKIDGNIFLVSTCNAEVLKKSANVYKKYNEQINKNTPPTWLIAIDYLLIAYSLLVATSLIEAIEFDEIKESFQMLFRNAPGIMYSFIVSVILCIVLRIVIIKWNIKNINDEKSIKAINKLNSSIDEIYKDLGCPNDYYNIDIFEYFIKKRKIVFVSLKKKFMMLTIKNVEFLSKIINCVFVHQ